jgi:phosphomannomutase
LSGAGSPPEQVIDFASAFGTFLGPGEVVIGRDPRESARHAAARA